MNKSDSIENLAAALSIVQIENFWAKVSKSDECWLFVGSRHHLGYGQFTLNGRVNKAHRVSWMIHYGEIPEGMCVLHRCDVRNCINPAHLFLGTQQDNIADMVAKGRQRAGRQRGVDNPMSKLTPETVKEIRAAYKEGAISQHKLAKLFKVSPMTVNRIVNHKLWSHI